MIQTWQKACACKDATARQGGVLVYSSTTSPRGLSVQVAVPSMPVCDSCDTPWVLADTPAKAEA